MGIAKFTDDFRTGDAKVDTQHEALFEMVNTLHDAIMQKRAKEAVMPTLEKLAQYTVEHFATEEKLMQAVGYPDYAAHKKAHEGLLAKATEIIEGYKSGKITLPMTLSRFLADWLRQHIKGTDKQMIKWVKQNSNKAA